LDKKINPRKIGFIKYYISKTLAIYINSKEFFNLHTADINQQL